VGRKIDPDRSQAILEAVQAGNGTVRAADLAKKLNLHPQEVSRVLTALEDKPVKQLCEDDRGFLSIFNL
jgi:DNA-binding IclR family transcriptional regulator